MIRRCKGRKSEYQYPTLEDEICTPSFWAPKILFVGALIGCYLAFTLEKPKPKPKVVEIRVEKILEKYDVNKDGILSREELSTLVFENYVSTHYILRE